MKTNANRFRRKAVLVSLVFMLAGCSFQPPPPNASFSCDSFSATSWEKFSFGVDSPKEVAAAAIGLWGLEKEQVRYRSVDAHEANLTWYAKPDGEEQVYYWSRFRDGSLGRITVDWSYWSPSLGQTIDCLGAPDRYVAFEEKAPEAAQIGLILFYTTSGFMVYYDSGFSSLIRQGLPTQFHPDMRVTKFAVVAPGPPEEMIVAPGFDSLLTARSVCLQRPWPGSIEAIEIASHSALLECWEQGS